MNKLKAVASRSIEKIKKHPFKTAGWVAGIAIALCIITIFVLILANFGGPLLAIVFGLMGIFLVGYKLFQGFPAIFGACTQLLAAGIIFGGFVLIDYANDEGSDIEVNETIIYELLNSKMGASEEVAQALAGLVGGSASMGMIVFAVIAIGVGLFIGLLGELVSATAGMVIYGQTISGKLGKLENLDKLKRLDSLIDINYSARAVSNEINGLRGQVGDLTRELERLKDSRLTEVND